MKSYNTSDVEYRGDYVTEIKYYEEWDEWHTQVCTSTDADGNVTVRDCSHRDYHGPQWIMETAGGKSYNINKNDYERMISQWKATPKFHDMKRDFYRIDGDMFSIQWNGNPMSIIPITTDNLYTNRVKGSKSYFGYEHISKNEAVELGLFDYPEITKQTEPLPQKVNRKTYQKSVLGYDDVLFLKSMDYINAKYGETTKLRTYMLFFKDIPFDIASKQKSYWEGGNFNEHIICVGINSTTGNIEWSDAFSWEDVPYLQTRTKQWLTLNNHIDSLKNFPMWYENILKENKTWVIKNKDDFDYLRIELGINQLMWALVISIIYCIGIGIVVVINQKTLI